MATKLTKSSGNLPGESAPPNRGQSTTAAAPSPLRKDRRSQRRHAETLHANPNNSGRSNFGPFFMRHFDEIDDNCLRLAAARGPAAHNQDLEDQIEMVMKAEMRFAEELLKVERAYKIRVEQAMKEDPSRISPVHLRIGLRGGNIVIANWHRTRLRGRYSEVKRARGQYEYSEWRLVRACRGREWMLKICLHLEQSLANLRRYQQEHLTPLRTLMLRERFHAPANFPGVKPFIKKVDVD